MNIIIRGEHSDKQNPVKYLIKEDKHEGTGVNFLFPENATMLLNEFQNGSLCYNKTKKGF